MASAVRTGSPRESTGGVGETLIAGHREEVRRLPARQEAILAISVKMDEEVENPLEAKNAIRFQPNPVNDQLTISFEKISTDQAYLIRLLSIEDKLLMEKNVTQNRNSINMSNFDNGVYLIEVYRGGEKQEQSKIVVSH